MGMDLSVGARHCLEMIPTDLMMDVCGGLTGVVMLSCTIRSRTSIVPSGTRLNDVYKSAISDGYISILKWLCSGNPLKNKKSIHSHVAMFGDRNVICWLYEHDKTDWERAYAAAAASGRLDRIVFFDGIHPIPTVAVFAAVKHNHKHIITWIYIYDGMTDCAMDYAAKIGNLDVVKWMDECQFPYNKPADAAARGGRLETLKWLTANGYCTTYYNQYHAAKDGHLNILKWFYERHQRISSIPKQHVMKHEHITVWLKEKNVPITD